MKTTLTAVGGAALLACAAVSVGQGASERQTLEARLAELRSEQADVQSQLEALDGARDERLAGVPAELPELRERFERMRAEEPERAERWRARHGERLERLRELRETDPEAYRKRIETMQALRRSGELAAEVATLEDAGKLEEAARVRETLRAEAGFIFERVLEERRAEIGRIEGRLTEARERLAEMEEKGPGRLDERVEQAVERARRRLNGGGERLPRRRR